MADLTRSLTQGISVLSASPEANQTSASKTDELTHRLGVEVVTQNIATNPSQTPLPIKPLESSSSNVRHLSSEVHAFVEKQSVLTTHYASLIQAGGALLDRTGKLASDFAVNSASADASGVLSGIGMLISAGLAIRTFVKDILLQRRQLSQMKQAHSLLKAMKERPGSIDLKKIESVLPKDLPLPTEANLDDTIRSIEERLGQAQAKLKSSSLKLSTQVVAFTVASANFLSKVMHVAGIALKFLGVISGVLILAVGVINLVSSARALRTTNQQIAKLKNELAVCQNPEKQVQLKEEISKLLVNRKAQIFSVVIASVEVTLGAAFIVANALSGGTASGVLMGLLAASSLISVVGNYCFSRQVQALQQPKAVAAEETKPSERREALMQPLLQRVSADLQQVKS